MSLFNVYIYIILYITWLSAYDTCLLMLFLHVVFSGKLWGTSTVTSTFRTLAGSGRSMEATGTETVRCCRWEAVILVGRWKNWEKTWKNLEKPPKWWKWYEMMPWCILLHYTSRFFMEAYCSGLHSTALALDAWDNYSSTVSHDFAVTLLCDFPQGRQITWDTWILV